MPWNREWGRGDGASSGTSPTTATIAIHSATAVLKKRPKSSVPSVPPTSAAPMPIPRTPSQPRAPHIGGRGPPPPPPPPTTPPPPPPPPPPASHSLPPPRPPHS